MVHLPAFSCTFMLQKKVNIPYVVPWILLDPRTKHKESTGNLATIEASIIGLDLELAMP